MAVSLLFVSQMSQAQGNYHSFELESGISIGNLGDRYDTEAHMGYDFSVAFFATEGVKIGISTRFANAFPEYDLVNSIGRQEIHLSSYEAFASYRIGNVLASFDLSATGSIGIAIQTTDEQSVSAGAFGFIKVPGRSERAAIYSVGLVASRELFSRVSAFVSSGLSLISPVQISSMGYSIGGGLSLGMF